MAPLTRDEARAALVSAIAARPSSWVARELAESLARLEYRQGARDAARRPQYAPMVKPDLDDYAGFAR